MAKITLTAVDGILYEVQEKKNALGKMVPFKLGAGGQGAAYVVKRQGASNTCAAKLYHDITPPEFNENLQKIVEMTSPHEAFIWPQKLLQPRKNGAIGFIMELYDNKVYRKFEDVAIWGKHQFRSRYAQLKALLELVSAFEALHATGHCFQDINQGAIVFDVERGRTKICDCENVAPEGKRIPIGYDNNGGKIYMQGFPRYKAPEVEIRAMLPDKYTDRYSLAVMIFMVLTCCHPLEGKKRFTYNPEGMVTPSVERDIYGANPIFIFDEKDSSNRPDPKEDGDALRAWPGIPSFIKELFVKAFCQGLPVKGKYDDTKKAERYNRPTEKQWREALVRWMDTLVRCSNDKCHLSFVADIDPRTFSMRTVCPFCGKDNQYDYPRMKIYKGSSHKRTIVLVPEREIPMSAISNNDSYDTAILVLKAKRPGIHGIKNTTNGKWICSCGQSTETLNPDDFVKLQPIMKIQFNFDYHGDIIM